MPSMYTLTQNGPCRGLCLCPSVLFPSFSKDLFIEDMPSRDGRQILPVRHGRPTVLFGQQLCTPKNTADLLRYACYAAS